MPNITVKDAFGQDQVLKTADFVDGANTVHLPEYGIPAGGLIDLGSQSETAYTGSGNKGVIGILKGIWNLLAGALTVRKSQQTVTAATINSGSSLTSTVDLGVTRVVGIVTPSVFEPTAITFQASHDGTTWTNVFDSNGTEKSAVVGANQRVILSPGDFLGIRYIRIRGGTAGSPTNVANNRIVQIISEA